MVPSQLTPIQGPSGSGKSTVIGLLERWYNPDSGSILLDGKDLRDLNVRWLRTTVRLVQQVCNPLFYRAFTRLTQVRNQPSSTALFSIISCTALWERLVRLNHTIYRCSVW